MSDRICIDIMVCMIPIQDELLWAALWLYDATNETRYLRYVVDNADTLGGVGWALDLFSWDNKFVGVQVKATKVWIRSTIYPAEPLGSFPIAYLLKLVETPTHFLT